MTTLFVQSLMCYLTETKMSPFWWNFSHFEKFRCSQRWKISSKLRYFRFTAGSRLEFQGSKRITSPCYHEIWTDEMSTAWFLTSSVAVQNLSLSMKGRWPSLLQSSCPWHYWDLLFAWPFGLNTRKTTPLVWKNKWKIKYIWRAHLISHRPT